VVIRFRGSLDAQFQSPDSGEFLPEQDALRQVDFERDEECCGSLFALIESRSVPWFARSLLLHGTCLCFCFANIVSQSSER